MDMRMPGMMPASDWVQKVYQKLFWRLGGNNWTWKILYTEKPLNVAGAARVLSVNAPILAN
jgi:hypothetical protein